MAKDGSDRCNPLNQVVELVASGFGRVVSAQQVDGESKDRDDNKADKRQEERYAHGLQNLTGNRQSLTVDQRALKPRHECAADDREDQPC